MSVVKIGYTESSLDRRERILAEREERNRVTKEIEAMSRSLQLHVTDFQQRDKTIIYGLV